MKKRLTFFILLMTLTPAWVSAKTPDYTIYPTDLRTGNVEWFNLDAGYCGPFGENCFNTILTAEAGYWQINDEGDIYYKFSRAYDSFDLSTVSQPVDSARVYIQVGYRYVDCTGDLNLGIYVGDCATDGIGGVGNCATALAIADSIRPSTLRYQAPISVWPSANQWITFKVTADSIVAGEGHTYDVRIAATANEVGSDTRVCACGNNTGDYLLLNTGRATAGHRPYMLIYAAASLAPTACTNIIGRRSGRSELTSE